MTRLGSLFKKKREANGLKVSELARLAGYKDLSNGGQRIHALEKQGLVHADLLHKLAAILGITEAEYTPLLRADEQDRLRAWAAWVNEPITPYMVIRQMAAMYEPMPLPDWIQSQGQAEHFVSERAIEIGLRCCLVWSRRLSIFFAADGSVEGVKEASFTEQVAPRQM